MEPKLPELWHRFDFVAVVDYVGHFKNRMPLFDQVMERVGLSGKVNRFWTFPNPFDKVYTTLFNKNLCMDRVGTFSCLLGHYRALKTAYALGYAHALVMENDVRFLKDLDRLATYIRSLPDDFDFAKFEWYTRNSRDTKSFLDKHERSLSSLWVPLEKEATYGAACTAYSRKGMAWKIGLIERALDYREEIRSPDCYDGFTYITDELNAFVSFPPVSIQGIPPGHRLHRANKPYIWSGLTRQDFDGEELVHS